MESDSLGYEKGAACKKHTAHYMKINFIALRYLLIILELQT